MSETTAQILGLISILIGIYTSKCELKKVKNHVLYSARARLLLGFQKHNSFYFNSYVSYSKS